MRLWLSGQAIDACDLGELGLIRLNIEGVEGLGSQLPRWLRNHFRSFEVKTWDSNQ